MRLQIRARLTLVFTGVSAIVLTVAAVGLLLGFRAELRRTVDGGLTSQFDAMTEDPVRAVGELAGSDETFAEYVRGEGTIVRNAEPPGDLLPLSVVRGISTTRFFDGHATDPDGEVVPIRILADRAGEGVLVLAVDVGDQRESTTRLTALVALGAPLLLVALAVLGWILAGGALRPVERLRAEAAALSTIEPSRRLLVPDTGDELERLAETLNGMLDRLHEALERERRFLDEASHELRTPLAVLKAELDLALKEPRSRDELELALRSMERETDRLGRLTQDLLVLARSDRGRLPVHRTETDVAELLARISAEFASRAEAVGVLLRVDADGVSARIDADRIRQAVENLVDNALRLVPAGGEIELWARRDGDGLHVSVRDSGPGFPEGLLHRAFERFARDEEPRREDGAGLGLAIVRAVAEAHGGRARAENPPSGGAAVSIDVPV
jgi:signal transduction histidine kinase